LPKGKFHHYYESGTKDHNEDALSVEEYLRAFGREDGIGDNANCCQHAYERCKIHKFTPKSFIEPDSKAPECGDVDCASETRRFPMKISRAMDKLPLFNE